jgi:hypothetical protein
VFSSGSPGLGFYDDRNDHQWNSFGVSNFAASAGPKRGQSHPAQRPSSR